MAKTTSRRVWEPAGRTFKARKQEALPLARAAKRVKQAADAAAAVPRAPTPANPEPDVAAGALGDAAAAADLAGVPVLPHVGDY